MNTVYCGIIYFSRHVFFLKKRGYFHQHFNLLILKCMHIDISYVYLLSELAVQLTNEVRRNHSHTSNIDSCHLLSFLNLVSSIKPAHQDHLSLKQGWFYLWSFTVLS